MRREDLTGCAEVHHEPVRKERKGKRHGWWKARATCGKVALLVSVGEDCESHLGVTPLPEITFIFREMKQGLKWY